MKASLAVFEAQDDEPLKQQHAQLQQRTIKQQEQRRELELKLKKTKEVYKMDDLIMYAYSILVIIVCHATRQDAEGNQAPWNKWKL